MDRIELAILQCMSYFGKSYVEALRTTIPEFEYLGKAYRLTRERDMQDIHLLAWKIREAKATKKQGKTEKYVFPKFRDFYNQEEEYNRALYGNTIREKSNAKDFARFNNMLSKKLNAQSAKE